MDNSSTFVRGSTSFEAQPSAWPFSSILHTAVQRHRDLHLVASESRAAVAAPAQGGLLTELHLQERVS